MCVFTATVFLILRDLLSDFRESGHNDAVAQSKFRINTFAPRPLRGHARVVLIPLLYVFIPCLYPYYRLWYYSPFLLLFVFFSRLLLATNPSCSTPSSSSQNARAASVFYGEVPPLITKFLLDQESQARGNPGLKVNTQKAHKEERHVCGHISLVRYDR